MNQQQRTAKTRKQRARRRNRFRFVFLFGRKVPGDLHTPDPIVLRVVLLGRYEGPINDGSCLDRDDRAACTMWEARQFDASRPPYGFQPDGDG